MHMVIVKLAQEDEAWQVSIDRAMGRNLFL